MICGTTLVRDEGSNTTGQHVSMPKAGPRLNIKIVIPSMSIPVLKIRRS